MLQIDISISSIEITFDLVCVDETSRDRHRVSDAAGTARYIPDSVVVMKGFLGFSVGQSYHVNSFADFTHIL